MIAIFIHIYADDYESGVFVRQKFCKINFINYFISIYKIEIS